MGRDHDDPRVPVPKQLLYHTHAVTACQNVRPVLNRTNVVAAPEHTRREQAAQCVT
jgi:hypothetical protein